MPTPNYINILATDCFMDATGELMAAGTLTITAVDGTGKSIPFHVGGGGIALVHSITRSISTGSMVGSLQLANPAAADISIGYTFVITDAATFETTNFHAVALTADGNGAFDLSELNAGSYAVAQPVAYVQGPPGPAGGSAAPLDLTAAVTISGSLAVAAIGGDAVLADSSTLAHRGCVIGLAVGTTLSGQPVEVQFEGEYTFSSWNWTLGLPVVLGLNGALTQTIPTSGFLQVVGTPLSSTSLLLKLQAPITLA